MSSPLPARFQSQAEEIVNFCRHLHAKNWLAACDGNLSLRVEAELILMTPSARHKGFINWSDLTLVTLDNKIIHGTPSGERLMHLELYRACPQATAIVHAHPPVATAWSVARPELRALPEKSLSEVILAVGRIPIVPYARPGTQDMGTFLKPELPAARVMILARHGALSWGESLLEAYSGIERLEHAATTLMHAETLGGLTELDLEAVEKLKRMRAEGPQKTL